MTQLRVTQIKSKIGGTRVQRFPRAPGQVDGRLLIVAAQLREGVQDRGRGRLVGASAGIRAQQPGGLLQLGGRALRRGPVGQHDVHGQGRCVIS